MPIISIISGSHRESSESRKVANYFQHILKSKSAEATVIDLAYKNIPMWDEGVWENTQKWIDVWQPISEQLTKSDGFILISPEWGGMATPAIKNFLLLAGDKSMANKPTLLTAVSSGRSGAYPISELRSSGYKNSGIVYLPEHIIVRDVKNNLNDFSLDDSSHDLYLKKRIDYSVNLLLEYSKALVNVRESGIVDYQAYEYGM